jgi:glyoxalase family protein
MQSPLVSLHHVTATVDGAQEDLDFAAGALGLRLVKQTVNFDNHNVFHFYYGDAAGSPGTLWTTFPYRGWGVRAGTIGAGQVTTTAFSVPQGSLDAWRERLAAAGATVGAIDRDAGGNDARLPVTDPSGLQLALVESADDARSPWLGGGMDAALAVRGLASVTLTVRRAAPTVEFLQEALGFTVVRQAGALTRLALGRDAAGHRLDVIEAPQAPAAVNGIGTVHHVALAIPTAMEQRTLREELVAMGRSPTEVRDRQYFQSIYFREPGGVLIEVATRAPGFAVDEPAESLGATLCLPPWEEPHRAAIERGLPAVRLPGGAPGGA